jgi:hypothetical protein
MAIVYRVYTNGRAGGPVDYSTPIASTSSLSYSAGPLSPSSDTTFAIRAFDTTTGIEESNSDAQVRLILDENGVDVSARPNPAHALSLSRASGGACRVSWAYAPNDQFTADAFNVYIANSASSVVSPPAATIPYVPGRIGYSCVLPGPYAYGNYTVTVHSVNSAGEDAGTVSIAGAAGISASTYSMEDIAIVLT